MAAARPLRVEELAEVLAFDFNAERIPKLNLAWRWEDQEEAVMSACSSLAMIVKDGDSRVVQFSHFSVKEFLTADRLAEPIRNVSRYHIRLEAAHTTLAEACLGTLLRLDDRVDRDNIKNFPLALYAAQYWAAHARFENASSRIRDGMECLFDANRSHFATWLWLYDEQGNSMIDMCPITPEGVPLYHASRLGFCGLAEHLLAKHPEHVNSKGGAYKTPMHVAATNGYADILALLIEHGAAVDNQPGSFNETPLHRAVERGKLEAGQYLLDHGADINARDRDGWTSLHWAIASPISHWQVVRWVLEHGADVNACVNDGWSPYKMARVNGKQEIVELLSKYGAKSVE